MMKILREGTGLDPANPWWVGARATCLACDTEVQLESGDYGRIILSSPVSTDAFCRFACPYCGESITVNRTNKIRRRHLFGPPPPAVPPEESEAR